ncbi:hypothetical protein ACGFJT_37445 [Actinomadura geliboluensis]|uniref:hypothetical protein n=1 Tax=Actinomadura geliboluensis TaxID=882440 RepID=UPI0037129CC9
MSEEQIRAAALAAASRLDLSTDINNTADGHNNELTTRTLATAEAFEDYIRTGKTPTT